MKKLMIAAAGMAALASTDATAQFYTYNYAALQDSNFAGSFTVQGTNGFNFTLSAFNGTIGGTRFTTSDVGLGSYGSGRYFLGGLLNGVGAMQQDSNDFIERQDFTPGVPVFTDAFNYTLAGSRAGFSSPLITFTQVSAAVPEPATWAMMITGCGMIGVALRRRNRVRVFYCA